MASFDWRKYPKFRYTGCGNCCRDIVVCITEEDARAIVAATRKSPLEFVRFFSEDEVQKAKRDPL